MKANREYTLKCTECGEAFNMDSDVNIAEAVFFCPICGAEITVRFMIAAPDEGIAAVRVTRCKNGRKEHFNRLAALRAGANPPQKSTGGKRKAAFDSLAARRKKSA